MLIPELDLGSVVVDLTKAKLFERLPAIYQAPRSCEFQKQCMNSVAAAPCYLDKQQKKKDADGCRVC